MVDYSTLLETNTSRAFLKQALQIQYRKYGRINLSDFSRKAGFSSRSFLSEYLSGKKNLSRESLRQIKEVLKVPKDYLKLFNLLVAIEQPEVVSRISSSTPQNLQELKNFLRKKHQTLSAIPDSQAFAGKRNLFRVYAALGSENRGATIKEIQERTGLEESLIAEELRYLLESHAVQNKENRYFAQSSQIDFLSIRSNELASLTQEVCQEIHSQANSLVVDENSHLFYTAFSMQSHQLKLFKKKLREAIYDVLDQFQNDDGDCVQQVFLCSKK